MLAIFSTLFFADYVSATQLVVHGQEHLAEGRQLTHDESVLTRQATFRYTGGSVEVLMTTPAEIDNSVYVDSFYTVAKCSDPDQGRIAIDMTNADLIWNNLGFQGPNTNECVDEGCMYMTNIGQVRPTAGNFSAHCACYRCVRLHLLRQASHISSYCTVHHGNR